jgi:hypothetical protein
VLDKQLAVQVPSERSAARGHLSTRRVPLPVALPDTPPGRGRARDVRMAAPGVMALGSARHGWLPAGDCRWRGHTAEPGMAVTAGVGFDGVFLLADAADLEVRVSSM